MLLEDLLSLRRAMNISIPPNVRLRAIGRFSIILTVADAVRDDLFVVELGTRQLKGYDEEVYVFDAGELWGQWSM